MAVERPPNPRCYSDTEREAILHVLNSRRFCDTSPEQVEAILAEEGKRIASARTTYRILADVQQIRERRNRRPHVVHHPPRLAAFEANPLCFIAEPPRRQQLPEQVWINPPVPEPDTTSSSQSASEEVLH
jgi:hypothetical protein